MWVDLSRYWYQRVLHPVTFLLLPFAYLFAIIVATRRWLYRIGILKTTKFKVPVIVVGNVTVGGTGKTPFVIWLASFLTELGYRPGIVSRGVGGKKQASAHWVTLKDSPAEVGDEALLLLQRTHCPVVICIDRVAAVQHLLTHSNCNVVLSDDGLQHYRLARDIAIVMVDALRRFGNRQLLPAGPLRESCARLQEVDFVVLNGGDANVNKYTMSVVSSELIAVNNRKKKSALNDFPHKEVHAVAGIGHPEKFFTELEHAGFTVIPHVFPDHHLYRHEDLLFDDALPIIMTEKDAVKCHAFADERYWYLQITAKLNSGFEQELQSKIQAMQIGANDEENLSSCVCDRVNHF